MTGAYTAKERLLAAMANHGVTREEVEQQLLADGYSAGAARLLSQDLANGKQCTIGAACALISVIVKQGRVVRN